MNQANNMNKCRGCSAWLPASSGIGRPQEWCSERCRKRCEREQQLAQACQAQAELEDRAILAGIGAKNSMRLLLEAVRAHNETVTDANRERELLAGWTIRVIAVIMRVNRPLVDAWTEIPEVNRYWSKPPMMLAQQLGARAMNRIADQMGWGSYRPWNHDSDIDQHGSLAGPLLPILREPVDGEMDWTIQTAIGPRPILDMDRMVLTLTELDWAGRGADPDSPARLTDDRRTP